MANELNKVLLVSAAREVGEVIKLNSKTNGAIYKVIVAASLVAAEFGGKAMRGAAWSEKDRKGLGNDVWRQVTRQIAAKVPHYEGSEAIWDAHIPGVGKDRRAKAVSDYIMACQKAKLKIIPTVAKAGTVFRKVFEDMVTNHADEVRNIATMEGDAQAEGFRLFFATTYGEKLSEVVAYVSKPTVKPVTNKIADFVNSFDSIEDLETLAISVQARIEQLRAIQDKLASPVADEEPDFEFDMAA